MGKKILKVFLIFLGVIILFGAVMLLIATRGLKEAKNLEISSIDLNTVDDGVYIGRYDNTRFSKNVEVTVENHQIVDISIVEQKDLSENELNIENQIIQNIIEKQQNDIDIVSGATATTKSFLKAVENALQEGAS